MHRCAYTVCTEYACVNEYEEHTNQQNLYAKISAQLLGGKLLNLNVSKIVVVQALQIPAICQFVYVKEGWGGGGEQGNGLLCHNS